MIPGKYDVHPDPASHEFGSGELAHAPHRPFCRGAREDARYLPDTSIRRDIHDRATFCLRHRLDHRTHTQASFDIVVLVWPSLFGMRLVQQN
jgi:hypothetical protein